MALAKMVGLEVMPRTPSLISSASSSPLEPVAPQVVQPRALARRSRRGPGVGSSVVSLSSRACRPADAPRLGPRLTRPPLRAGRALARSTTWSAVKPNFSMTTATGAGGPEVVDADAVVGITLPAEDRPGLDAQHGYPGRQDRLLVVVRLRSNHSHAGQRDDPSRHALAGQDLRHAHAVLDLTARTHQHHPGVPRRYQTSTSSPPRGTPSAAFSAVPARTGTS